MNRKNHVYNFLYLIGEKHGVSCELDILFMRRDEPGGAITYGDLDNRLKTLFDALKAPTHNSELPDDAPSDGENPFFCLLDDDKYIEKFTITTDRLLTPPTSDTQQGKGSVLLVIGVKTIVFNAEAADWWQVER